MYKPNQFGQIQIRLRVILYLIATISITAVNAQWLGTNPLHTTSKVGIGTTSPLDYLNIINDKTFSLPQGSIYPDGFKIEALENVPFSGSGTVLNPHFVVKRSGYVGIGTNSPNSYLNIHTSTANSKMLTLTKTNSTTNNRLQLEPLCNNVNLLNMNPIIQTGDAAIIFSDQLNGNSSLNSGFVLAPQKSFSSGMRMDANGNVTFLNSSLTFKRGTVNQFRIQSDGFMIARQIDVHLDPIPDFVFHAAFNKDSAQLYRENGTYTELSLPEVEQFIKTNRHLPGIKSAADYKEEGSINIGELSLKLLEKVEELTLYNIKLQKEIEALKAK